MNHIPDPDLNTPSPEAITATIKQLSDGQDAQVDTLWQFYFKRLLTFTRSRMKYRPSAMSDEEDIALSAFNSVCMGLRDGKFPSIENRDSLWRLLVTIAARKHCDVLAYEQRQKRSAQRTRSYDVDELLITNLLQSPPTVQTEVEFNDLLNYLIDGLRQSELQTVALMKLEGFTNLEIATHIDRSLATVERKLSTIREIWKELVE